MGKSFRIEFDPQNKILVMRFENTRLTDESLAEVYAANREYAIATDAYAGIADFSAVIHVDLSAAFIRQLAHHEPAMPRATERARIVVFADDVGFGMARMFQMPGEPTRPLFLVVRSLDEALEALGVEGAHFEPLT